jgi:zinc finger SWIM domain-containing protein 3
VGPHESMTCGIHGIYLKFGSFNGIDPIVPYNFLCRIFNIAAARAATFVESFAYMENQSNILIDQIDQVIQTSPTDIANLIGANFEQTQNSVDNFVAEGIQSHTNFLNGSCIEVLVFFPYKYLLPPSKRIMCIVGSLTFPFTLGADTLDYS